MTLLKASVEPELLATLDDAAQRRGMTRAGMLRRALELFLEESHRLSSYLKAAPAGETPQPSVDRPRADTQTPPERAAQPSRPVPRPEPTVKNPAPTPITDFNISPELIDGEVRWPLIKICNLLGVRPDEALAQLDEDEVEGHLVTSLGFHTLLSIAKADADADLAHIGRVELWAAKLP